MRRSTCGRYIKFVGYLHTYWYKIVHMFVLYIVVCTIQSQSTGVFDQFGYAVGMIRTWYVLTYPIRVLHGKCGLNGFGVSVLC